MPDQLPSAVDHLGQDAERALVCAECDHARADLAAEIRAMSPSRVESQSISLEYWAKVIFLDYWNHKNMWWAH